MNQINCDIFMTLPTDERDCYVHDHVEAFVQIQNGKTESNLCKGLSSSS